MRHEYKKTWITLLVALAGACLLVLFGMSSNASSAALGTARLQVASETPPLTVTVTVSPTLTATITPTPTATPKASIFMPLMSVFKTPPVELLNAWTSDTGGGKVQAFLPGVGMAYNVSGLNNLGDWANVGLRWDQSGACGPTQVFSDTLNVPAGAWTFTKPSTAPSCTGVFTAITSLTYEDLKLNRVSRFVVNQPGSIQISVQQGFDRCYAPDLGDMQRWWDESPYLIYNLYLGGVSFACKDQPLDAVWVHQAAQQGWYFILAWVGPQAPCTSYKYRMSSDPDKAYQQGRDEASSAHSAAVGLGFFGPKVIYYDIEAYTGASSSCRQAVSKFMEGWTHKLQELGDKAGGYGGACSSYVSDWAGNNPPPDDVWLAHWIRKYYDADVTVWDAPCVDNGLWTNHQRLKQYAGGHKETWGGVQLTIDSNVLDGEVNALQPSGAQASGQAAEVIVDMAGSDLREVGLVAPSQGWLLTEDKLLWTDGGREGWIEITPAGMAASQILEARFFDAQSGWVVGMTGGDVVVMHTQDGGVTWASSRLPGDWTESSALPQEAHLEAVDGQTVFAALKMPSGSSFSVGQLYASVDGGETWEQRSLPLGEGVAFEDALNGWTAGGASGNELYSTTDGGYSWEAISLPVPQGQRVELSLPRFNGASEGQLVAVLNGEVKQQLALFTTHDGGETWQLERHTAHVPGGRLAGNLPASGILGSELSLDFDELDRLPEGTTTYFAHSQSIWTLVEGGDCQGDKRAPGGTVLCTQRRVLLASNDSGETWREIITPE